MSNGRQSSALVKRRKVVQSRVDQTHDVLLKDIDRWKSYLENTNGRSSETITTLKHHVEQFRIFCEQARQCLLERYDYSIGAADQEQSARINDEQRTKFDALIAGTLTSQWSVLRAVAAQRMPDHPYENELAELDKYMDELYG